MTDNQFYNLADDLVRFARKYDFSWGATQNDYQDSLANIWNIPNSETLMEGLDNSDLTEDNKSYIMKRWFSFKVAKCDEHIFCMNPNVEPNPNIYDKDWDFVMNDIYKWDLKDTVLPRQFEYCMLRPSKLIDWYYKNQSLGSRLHFQNRIFLVHFSLIDPNRADIIKTKFKAKIDIIKEYCEQKEHFWHKYDKYYADCIFVYEDKNGDIKYNWFS